MAHAEIQALVADPEVRPLFFQSQTFTDAEGHDKTVEVQRNYLRKHQRDEAQQEITALQVPLDDPIARKAITEPGRVTKRLAALRHDVRTQSPPPLSPSLRDKVAKINRLCRETFTQGMPTDEQMRRKPPGAVDQHMAWDRENKQAVLLWKTSQILLHPQAGELDLCNVERFRPNPATRNLNTDAQIPGVFALSPEAKANYDAINWDSPEVAAKIQELIDAGRVRVNTGVRRGALRTQKNSKTYECSCAACQSSGRIWTGPMAAARLQRHKNELERAERTQEVAT